MATDLICPKCQGPMRSYERNGIQIDQCTECRGVFLDRGELEHLIDAEAAYNQNPGSGPAQASTPTGSTAPGWGWEQGSHHGKSGYGGHHGKRRKGFLGELFD